MNKIDFDNFFRGEKYKLLAGVDEAGRGPLAGPVVAAAVIIDDENFIKEIDDSKKLSEKKREELFDIILNQSISYGIAEAGIEKIEEVNILQASLSAMKNAVGKLNPAPDIILVDGNKLFASNVPAHPIVKGDAKSYSIGAASILAKVWRDRLMRKAAESYPEYGWERNKGYGTKEHIEAIKRYGITPLHRKKFLRKIFNVETTEEVENLFS